MNPNKQKAIDLHKQMLLDGRLEFPGLCTVIEFYFDGNGFQFISDFVEICKPLSNNPQKRYWAFDYSSLYYLLSDKLYRYDEQRQRLFLYWIENSKLLNDDTQTASH